LTAVSYRLFGLTVRASSPLFGIEPTPQAGPPDVTIDLAGQVEPWPALSSAWVPAASNLPVWRLETDEGEYTLLTYGKRLDQGASGIGFLIDPSGTRVWARWSSEVTPSGLLPVLLGPVLGCVLRRRGRVVLHGAAVAVDQRAVVLLGAREAGKSTTALAMARQGAGVLADDMSVLSDLEGKPRVEAGEPRVRLGLDRARLTEGLPGAEIVDDDDAWPPVDKREVRLPRHTYEAVPLAGIYVLGGRERNGASAPAIVEAPVPSALASVMAHRYTKYIIGREGHARDFAALSGLVDKVPVYDVRRTDRLESVPELATALLEHAATVLPRH
jgi:hypothetical protein